MTEHTNKLCHPGECRDCEARRARALEQLLDEHADTLAAAIVVGDPNRPQPLVAPLTGSSDEPRLTVDTITSDQLDALQDRLERAEQDLAAWHEADSADAAAGSYAGRAEQAEAAIARVREYVGRAANTPLPTGYDDADRATRDYAREILAALDEPKEPTP